MRLDELKRAIAELTQYMGQNGVTIDPLPRLVFRSNPAYREQMFCPTAHYSPVDKTITVYVAGRHPKDIMRSYAHELIHHDQYCKGMMDEVAGEGVNDPNYAQNNKVMREMEKDAYLRGNMMFRDWTDTRKRNN